MADTDTTTAEKCRRCGGEMQRGFLLDEGRTFWSMSRPASWHPGRVAPGWFGSVEFQRDRLLQVVADRCSGCGLLEFYAPPVQR